MARHDVSATAAIDRDRDREREWDSNLAPTVLRDKVEASVMLIS